MRRIVGVLIETKVALFGVDCDLSIVQLSEKSSGWSFFLENARVVPLCAVTLSSQRAKI